MISPGNGAGGLCIIVWTNSHIVFPNNVNIGFGGCDSESIVQYLDMYDICCSAGSACHSKSVEPSATLRALRLPSKYINGSVRFTLSKDNTKEEIDEVIGVLKQFYASKDKEF